MKLIIAIVSNKDVSAVFEKLGLAGLKATKISTTGMFLEDGNSCILIGVEQEKVQSAIDIIKGSVSKRIVYEQGVRSTLAGTFLKQPVDVEKYGGVAFVLDVEDFVKF